jgi:aarF domain-containing kinase
MKNGNVVAVKVQHKFVKKHSFVDIYTMDFLVRSVKFFFPQFEFMWLAEEMKKNMPLELAFTQEAKNAEKVAKIMRKAFMTDHYVKHTCHQ